MAYQRPTIQTIYGRIKADMESRVTSGVKIPTFSLLGVLAIVFAGAIHLVYGYLDFISLQLFVDTATKEWLDRLGNMYGIPRKAATFATGEVTFSGTDGTTIPAGTALQNEDGIRYSTVSDVIISSGFALADVQADVEGEVGNNTYSSVFLVSPISGVDTEATISTPIEGGVDQETDDELRVRVLFRMSNPPASGNAADYQRWATEVAGVGKAWTITADQYQGAGTVAVIIATNELEVVDTAVKAEVIANIEEQRPIGASVDVLDIDAKDTDYTLKISPYTSDLISAVEESLRELHLAEAAPSGTILLSHIQAAIAASGVNDYVITDIEVDGISIGVNNIEMDNLEVARYGSATITAV